MSTTRVGLPLAIAAAVVMPFLPFILFPVHARPRFDCVWGMVTGVQLPNHLAVTLDSTAVSLDAVLVDRNPPRPPHLLVCRAAP